ncbi:hypothetical protein GCM10028798_33300 [Humibacter antri]
MLRIIRLRAVVLYMVDVGHVLFLSSSAADAALCCGDLPLWFAVCDERFERLPRRMPQLLAAELLEPVPLNMLNR